MVSSVDMENLLNDDFHNKINAFFTKILEDGVDIQPLPYRQLLIKIENGQLQPDGSPYKGVNASRLDALERNDLVTKKGDLYVLTDLGKRYLKG